MKAILAVAVFLSVFVTGQAVASDPAGAWTTCVDNNGSGKQIVVAGPRCPRGFRKVY